MDHAALGVMANECVNACCSAGIDYQAVREEHPTEIFIKVFTFNSARKSMTTVIPLPGGGYRMLTKGASEIVLKKCTSVLGENGRVLPLSTDDVGNIVNTVVQPMAEGALRTICLAYRYYVGVYFRDGHVLALWPVSN